MTVTVAVMMELEGKKAPLPLSLQQQVFLVAYLGGCKEGERGR
jgi:hypothetical protein